MKGEIDIHVWQHGPYKYKVWTLTLFHFEFPLDKNRKKLVSKIKAMPGFVGWCDPKRWNERDGSIYFALFDSEENAKSAGEVLHKEGVPIGCNFCKHYAKEKYKSNDLQEIASSIDAGEGRRGE